MALSSSRTSQKDKGIAVKHAIDGLRLNKNTRGLIPFEGLVGLMTALVTLEDLNPEGTSLVKEKRDATRGAAVDGDPTPKRIRKEKVTNVLEQAAAQSTGAFFFMYASRFAKDQAFEQVRVYLSEILPLMFHQGEFLTNVTSALGKRNALTLKIMGDVMNKTVTMYVTSVLPSVCNTSDFKYFGFEKGPQGLQLAEQFPVDFFLHKLIPTPPTISPSAALGPSGLAGVEFDGEQESDNGIVQQSSPSDTDVASAASSASSLAGSYDSATAFTSGHLFNFQNDHEDTPAQDALVLLYVGMQAMITCCKHCTNAFDIKSAPSLVAKAAADCSPEIYKDTWRIIPRVKIAINLIQATPIGGGISLKQASDAFYANPRFLTMVYAVIMSAFFRAAKDKGTRTKKDANASSSSSAGSQVGGAGEDDEGVEEQVPQRRYPTCSVSQAFPKIYPIVVALLERMQASTNVTVLTSLSAIPFNGAKPTSAVNLQPENEDCCGSSLEREGV